MACSWLAIAARALIGHPSVLLADEPTSALDADARDAYLALLLEQSRRSGSAVLFVSHDASLAPRFDRTLQMEQFHVAG